MPGGFYFYGESLACIIHEATCEFSFYAFIHIFCGKFTINPKMTDYLLTLGAESS